MSVDNLPAELPRDATEYFGNSLLPAIESFVKEGPDSSVIKRATITSQGELEHRHKWLNSHFFSQKKVLILGSGFVAGPVVKHLGSLKNVELIIGSNLIDEATKLSYLAKNGAKVVNVNVTEEEELDRLIKGTDLVISLIPATMHLPVAHACLKNGAHLITASYISPKMQELHEQVQARGLAFLNEVGLDPGLDHLSAKKIIDETLSQGHQITSFTSWCGGLPAPECADNPLGYKFSWSPRGVLLAALNDARYRSKGQEVRIPGEELLASVQSRPFDSRLNLEGIPNRDSLKYEQLYGIEGIPTMLRGTLRYNGFCSVMKSFRKMGLFNLDPNPFQFSNCKNWSEVFQKLDTTGLDQTVREAIEWLGVNSTTEPFSSKSTMLDSFCDLLQKKLKYGPEERDMVVMQHEFAIKKNDGSMEKKSSSLIEYGELGGFTAMARTVGYPVAVAAEMILEGSFTNNTTVNGGDAHHTGAHTGVMAPLHPTIYNPMLQRLEQLANIRFKESTTRLIHK
jgi:alpha-aminoadipic semialdehyde synthase